MTPAEAGAVEYLEPDWREAFEEECARWAHLPRYLAEDSAFPEVMKRWRRWHWTPVVVDGEEKKMPAGAVEAIIALAQLRIMPPRSVWRDIPRDDAIGYQCDDHMWLSINQEQWRVVGVEARMLCLEKMSFDDSRETKQIDLNRAKWDTYVESAVAVLRALDETSKSDLK